MKCPLCQGMMVLKADKIEQDGVAFDAFRCTDCGEEIMTMKQLKVLAGKYRKLRKAKEITFAQWGNSLAVRIPRDVAEEYHLSAGSQAMLVKEKEGMRIIPGG